MSKERMGHLQNYAPRHEDSVAVAGGMYWARYEALPGPLPELSDSLRAALDAQPQAHREAQKSVVEVWIPTQVRLQGGVLAEIAPAPKPLAMYFPQFHAIPENDRFWGEGFTEWSLLKPYQGEGIRKPLPVEKGGLGYYDPTNREVRRRQGEMARDHGLHGFVYYHYWFSSVVGHKVMYKVPELRVSDGEPNLPFMLSWANEAWSRHWDGADEANSTMLAQDYGREDEWLEHINYLLPIFKHPKYIKVEGKPAFSIYRPGLMHAKLEKMLKLWHRRAIEEGFPGLHIIATVGTFYRQPDERPWQDTPTVSAAWHYLASDHCCWEPGHEPPAPAYKQTASTSWDSAQVAQKVQYWGAFAGFDNRPRQHEAPIYPQLKITPDDLGVAVGYSLDGMSKHPERDISDNLYFLASWNEWNEQSILEPDDTYKFGMLEAVSDKLRRMPVRVFVPP